jgi:hypothetical protein
MSSSKQNDLKRDFAAGVYLSESQDPISPPPPTHCKYTCIVYTVYLFTLGRGGGGEFNQREGYRGSFTVPATRNSTDQQAVPANLFRNSCKN